MKTDKPMKIRKGRNIVITFAVIVLVLVMFIPIPAIVLNVLMAVNLFLALAIFLTTVFTGCQRRTKDNEKTIFDAAAIFYIFPVIFLLYSIFGLMVYVTFTRLILTKGAGTDNEIISFFSGLVNTGETAGIITGFVSIIAFCTVVIVPVKKWTKRAAELAGRFVLSVMPGAIADMDHAYTCGKISEKEFIARKDNIVKQADFWGSMDGAGKFIAGNVTVMICIMTAVIFGGIITGTRLHGKTILEAAEAYIAFGISGGIIFLLPHLLLSAALSIVSGRVYEFSVRQLTDGNL
jgi:flagellar biosynthesis protein FlhA